VLIIKPFPIDSGFNSLPVHPVSQLFWHLGYL
jgi:hypothetical protein